MFTTLTELQMVSLITEERSSIISYISIHISYWCGLSPSTVSVNSVSIQLPAAVLMFQQYAMSVDSRTSTQHSEQPAVWLSQIYTLAQTNLLFSACYILSLTYPKTQLCKICTIYIKQGTVGKTEFDLLIVRRILIGGTVNYCNKFEF